MSGFDKDRIMIHEGYEGTRNNSVTDFARWQGAWQALGVMPPAGSLFTELVARYAEPQRVYHNLVHLRDCLARLDAVRALAQQPAELELALWFHDAIYDTHRVDNEAASAQWAQTALLTADVQPASAQRVADLILLTKHNTPPPDNDAALLLDIDLAILGADRPRFDAYETQIRQEYAWVAWPDFCAGRAKVLQRFLARPAIYYTDDFRALFESQARANLCYSLTKLATAA